MKDFKMITAYTRSMQNCCLRLSSGIDEGWLHIKVSSSIEFSRGLHVYLVLINPETGLHIEIDYCPFCGKSIKGG